MLTFGVHITRMRHPTVILTTQNVSNSFRENFKYFLGSCKKYFWVIGPRLLGVHHFSLEILTKIATNFGKDFNGKVVDPLHSRSDHKKIFFVMIPKNILNYPQRYMLVVGTPE